MTAREDILSRIRAALPGDSSAASVSRGSILRTYEQRGERSETERVALLLDRLRDYDAEIIQVASREGVAAAITQTLSNHRETRVIAPEVFPATWSPRDVFRDDACSVAEIESMQAALTTCEVAIASTGTIVLVHGGGAGSTTVDLVAGPSHLRA